MKVFLSVPMRGRDAQAIADSIAVMKRIASAMYFGKEIEFIDNFVEPDETIKNKSVWCLGQAIQKLANADLVVGPDNTFNFPGCDTELKVADDYSIEVVTLPLDILAPDASTTARYRQLKAKGYSDAKIDEIMNNNN